MKKALIIGALLSLFVFVAPVHADCTISQTANSNTNINSIGYPTQKFGGQPFTPSCSGTITTVTLGLSNPKGSTGWHASIYSQSGSSPGTDLADSQTATLNGVACGDANVTTFTFSSPVSVTSGTTYWMVGTRDNTDTVHYGDACGDTMSGNLFGLNDVVTSIVSGGNYTMYDNFTITGSGGATASPFSKFIAYWW